MALQCPSTFNMVSEWSVSCSQNELLSSSRLGHCTAWLMDISVNSAPSSLRHLNLACLSSHSIVTALGIK